jgi:hypothetical protein
MQISDDSSLVITYSRITSQKQYLKKDKPPLKMKIMNLED